MQPTYILGISAYYHDSAAALLRDGEIVAAGIGGAVHPEEGRSAIFPARAVEYCLKEAGITAGRPGAVGFYDKPLLKFERILETYLGVAPRGFRPFLMAGPLWIKDKLWTDRASGTRSGATRATCSTPSTTNRTRPARSSLRPFREAAILTMDGVGEWATASIGVGRGAEIELLKELRWPDSLGLLYSAFTYYTGFKVNSGEYKVMGLAPYGEPKYVDLIYEHLIDLKEDGSFRLNQKYFNYLDGLTMTSRASTSSSAARPGYPRAS